MAIVLLEDGDLYASSSSCDQPARFSRAARASPARHVRACSPPITEILEFGHVHRKLDRKRARTAVVAGAEAAADDHGQLRHAGQATAVTIFAPSLAIPPASCLRRP